MGITVATLKDHRTALLEKLGVRSLPHAVNVACQRALLDQETAAVGLDNLTDRELESLRLTAAGYAPLEVAAQLFVSVHTVKGITRQVRTKLAARNLCHAVRIAHQHGLLPMGVAA